MSKGTDSSIAMIKFIVGLDRIRRDVGPRAIATGIHIVDLPDWFPPIYNGGVRCVAATGPCCCGAWHCIGEERDYEQKKTKEL